jgi:hypothetical protein
LFLTFFCQGATNLAAAGIPSSVKVRQRIDGTVLDKSYSPITPPSTAGTFDLLVKSYCQHGRTTEVGGSESPEERGAAAPLVPPTPDLESTAGTSTRTSGLGHHMCMMKPGQTIEIRFKPERFFNGTPYTVNRWDHLLLIAGGTGIAPLFQVSECHFALVCACVRCHGCN